MSFVHAGDSPCPSPRVKAMEEWYSSSLLRAFVRQISVRTHLRTRDTARSTDVILEKGAGKKHAPLTGKRAGREKENWSSLELKKHFREREAGQKREKTS